MRGKGKVTQNMSGLRPVIKPRVVEHKQEFAV